MDVAAEVIGIDHIYLTVSAMERSERFYDCLLLEPLGFRKNTFTLDGDGHVHYYNRYFGIVLRPSRGDGRPHDRYAPGFHHLCLRVPGVEDVERVAETLGAAGILATPSRRYEEYAPDYYATFVEDPDGLRLKIANFRTERRERMQHWEAGSDRR